MSLYNILAMTIFVDEIMKVNGRMVLREFPLFNFNTITEENEPVRNTRTFAYARRNDAKFRNKKRYDRRRDGS